MEFLTKIQFESLFHINYFALLSQVMIIVQN